MRYDNRIKTRLEKLPLEASVTFLLRCSLRMLPWLTKAPDGRALEGRQKTDLAEHLLSVFRACDACSAVVLGRKRVGLYEVISPILYDVKKIANSSVDIATTSVICGVNAYLHAIAAEDEAVRVYADTSYDAIDAAGEDAASDAAATIAAIASIEIIERAELIIPEFYKFVVDDIAAIEKETAISVLNSPLEIFSRSDVYSTQITEFKEAIGALNAGFEPWIDWFDARCRGDALAWDTLQRRIFLPQSIRSQTIAEINAYLFPAPATRPLNRVRAIFIGDGAAGKTSLIRVLHHQPITPSELATPGIAIHEWQIPDSPVIAHFWDFGGQVVMHAVHQLFLRENCLYVLVVSTRSGITDTEQAEYWLEHVKSFGQGAKVMIVENRLDEGHLHLDRNSLREKYGAMLAGFYPLSCAEAFGRYAESFNVFKQEFCKNLQQVGVVQVEFSEPHFKVLTDLRKRTPREAFVSHDTFCQLCRQHGVDKYAVLNDDWLLKTLDSLGVIIHFPRLKFFDDHVLNPRWLTYGIYTLMVKNQPRLTSEDIITILQSATVEDEHDNVLTYPASKCGFIRAAMGEFRLCYPLPNDENTIIIPSLLATEQQHDFSKIGALAFSFAFPRLLPRNVLPELIVTRYREIDRQMVWQHGVVFRSLDNTARALLQVDYHLRILNLWVSGVGARDYWFGFVQDVAQIAKRINIEYSELISLPTSARVHPSTEPVTMTEQARLRQVLANERAGRNEFIADSGNEYWVAAILGRYIAPGNTVVNQYFMAPEATGVVGRWDEQVIVNSTIHGNAINGSKLEQSFNQRAPEAAQIVQRIVTKIHHWWQGE